MINLQKQRDLMIVVMMSSRSPSMCLEFDGDKRKHEKLSPEQINDIVIWATQFDTSQLFFLASEEPWDVTLSHNLESLASHVMVPLMANDEQQRLNIPFSPEQIVIAKCLSRLKQCANHIAHRPIILHIGVEEIPELANTLISLEGSISQLQLYLHNINQFTPSDIDLYRQQLELLATRSLMLSSASLELRFYLHNIKFLKAKNSNAIKCVAGKAFIIFGPDGLIYPCPAFYHLGHKHAMGSINESTGLKNLSNCSEDYCGICGSNQCSGCPFAESLSLSGKEQVCKVQETEKNIDKAVIQQCAESPYLFDCFRTIKTNQIFLKSKREGNLAGLTTGEQSGVTLTEFTNALQDIASLANHILYNDVEGAFEVDRHEKNNQELEEGWGEIFLPQRDIFRQRIKELFARIGQLGLYSVYSEQVSTTTL